MLGQFWPRKARRQKKTILNKFIHDNEMCLNFKEAFECTNGQVNTVIADDVPVKYAITAEDSLPTAIKPYK